MGIATGLGRFQQFGGCFAAWCAKQGQGFATGHGLKSIGRLFQIGTVICRTPSQIFACRLTSTWANFEIPCVQIGTPISMVKGVGGKFMPVVSLRFPPRRPMRAHAAIALLCFFVGCKVRDGHLVFA